MKISFDLDNEFELARQRVHEFIDLRCELANYQIDEAVASQKRKKEMRQKAALLIALAVPTLHHLLNKFFKPKKNGARHT